jgi:hypothetical protein
LAKEDERMLRHLRLTGLAAALVFAAAPASARPLDRLIPELFGGTLATTIDPRAQADLQQVLVAERFQGLSAALAAARSQAPVPSASGAFRFAWDPDLDTFVRYEQSLGSPVAERAQTLGRHTFTFGFSYTYIDFSTLEGDPISKLSSTQPALSPEFLASLPVEDQMAFGDDVLQTNLDLRFKLDLFYLTAAYGVTDDIDVSMALSINRAAIRGRALARIIDPLGNGTAVFAFDQKGVITGGGIPGCDIPNTCAVDGFNQSAVGTGDLFLRGKWHFMDTKYADLAAAGVLTLPTGNADNFLGFHDVTFTPWLIASKTFGLVSPHLNLGYAFRSSKDVSQAEWIAGADLRAADLLETVSPTTLPRFRWGDLTLSADFLGYHDDKRDGINDDIVQSALSFKIHPFGQLVIAGSFQLPVNRDGLRADVIYTGQLEYTF